MANTKSVSLADVQEIEQLQKQVVKLSARLRQGNGGPDVDCALNALGQAAFSLALAAAALTCEVMQVGGEQDTV